MRVESRQRSERIAVEVTHCLDQTVFNGAFSPDQKRWAIVRGNISADVVLVSERD